MALRRRGSEYRKYLRANSDDVVIPERTLRRWLKEGKITKAKMLELGIVPGGSRKRCQTSNSNQHRRVCQSTDGTVPSDVPSGNTSCSSSSTVTLSHNDSTAEMYPVGEDEMDVNRVTETTLQDESDEENFVQHGVTSVIDSDEESLVEGGSEPLTFLSGHNSEEISNILESETIGVDVLNKPLADGFTITKFETLLMIFHLAMRHSLTDSFLTDILQFVNVLAGGVNNAIPESMYLFRRLFLFGSVPTVHFFCPECRVYLGSKACFTSKDVTCDSCEWQQSVSSHNDGNYFITLSIRDQLKKVLRNPGLKLSSKNRQSDDLISDMYDGQIYADLMRAHKEASALEALTISISTDGSPVFKNGPNSLWPIHFHLNEVEPSQRFSVENIMLGGLWFSKKGEPDIQVFLKPMVEELKELSINGLKWKNTDGDLIESPIYLICCCADTVARPKVQAMMQFNGYYGCSYCLHPNTCFVVEESVNPRSGFTISSHHDDDESDEDDGTNATVVRRKKHLRYLIDDSYPYPCRTNKQLRDHMLVASRSHLDHIYGAKGLSVLSELPYFNVVFGFPIDYMHSCLLGCMKRLAHLWFDRTSNGQKYYIGLQIERVNKKLASICTPSNVTRPRPMTDRVHWKAKEWRSFLLYYGLPCLLGILPEAYYMHFKKFAAAIHILTRESIAYEEVNQSNKLLHMFVIEYQLLYGRIHMVFNVHALTHLALTVKKVGPLWAYSMFPFESANGRLLKLVKGTKSICVQLAHKYLMMQNVSDTLCGTYRVSEPILDFCCKVVEYRYLKHSKKLGCVELLGKPCPIEINNVQKDVILRETGIEMQIVSAFKRATMNGVIYSSLQSGQQKVHNDSCVKLQNGSFCLIDWIIVLEPDNDCEAWCLVREINIASNASNFIPEYLKQCSMNPYGSIKAVPFLDISKKCMYLTVSGNNYVAEFTNTFEKS